MNSIVTEELKNKIICFVVGLLILLLSGVFNYFILEQERRAEQIEFDKKVEEVKRFLQSSSTH